MGRVVPAYEYEIGPGNGENRFVVRVGNRIVGRLSGSGGIWKAYGPDNQEMKLLPVPYLKEPGSLSKEEWEGKHRFWAATKLTEALYESGWLLEQGLASEGGYYGRFKGTI